MATFGGDDKLKPKGIRDVKCAHNCTLHITRNNVFPKRSERSGSRTTCSYTYCPRPRARARARAGPLGLSHSRRDFLLNHLFVTPRDIIDPGFSAARTHRRASYATGG